MILRILRESIQKSMTKLNLNKTNRTAIHSPIRSNIGFGCQKHKNIT